MIYKNRKCCQLTKFNLPIGFNLVDYRNNYFTSDNFDKILQFFNGFENRRQLIEWMAERPKGSADIYEVEGDKNIIVVIPTADIFGQHAKACRDIIFTGLHIIFVVSGEIPDHYFNFAHNVNLGINKAMEYNPKWVIYSNDDVFKIDEIMILRRELNLLDNRAFDIIIPKRLKHHITYSRLSEARFTRLALFFILGKKRRIQLKLEKKFNVKYFITPNKGYWKFFFKRGEEFLSISTFGVFSSNFLKRHELVFDETFINGGEDLDLSLYVNQKARIWLSNFRIGDYIGSSLGRSINRHIRDVAGLAYFNFKLENYYSTYI